jgi:hypothetical protein
MRQYNAFQALYLAFYSKKLYKDVAKNWGGYAFFYLSILLAISWLPFVFYYYHTFDKFYDTKAALLIPQIPTLTIQAGKIMTPENHPYFVTDPYTQERIAVIDTSGTYKTLEDANAKILVTQGEILAGPHLHHFRTNKLPNDLNLLLIPTVVDHYIKQFAPYILALFFLVAVLFSFVYRLFQVILYGLLGKLFNMLFKIKLSFQQNIQIMMVAITPVILLSTFFNLFDLHFSYQSLCYFLIALAYFFTGLLANKQFGIRKRSH